MWQETQDKFIQGCMGSPADVRTLKLFWNIMDSLQYPLAKTILAGIVDNEKHLPEEVEQAIMNNPELMQLIMQTMEGMKEQRGGARQNSGPKASGVTRAAQVEKTNARDAAAAKEPIATGQTMGGMNENV